VKFPILSSSPSAAFSVLLIAAVLGCGVFFDHLAEAQPAVAPAPAPTANR